MMQNTKKVSYHTINHKLQGYIMIMIIQKDPLQNHRLPTMMRNISITTVSLLQSNLSRDRIIN